MNSPPRGPRFGASSISHQGSPYDSSSGSAMAPWWGPHPIPLDDERYWRIGPLKLWAEHRLYQWALAWEYGLDWLSSEIQVNSPRGPNVAAPSPRAERLRCAYRESVNELSFAPALADRSLVTKLEHPLRVLPGEDTQLFVCSPLWLKIETTQPQKPMAELPIYRLSDTWFGPAGPGGELAYASRVPVYLQLSDVPLRLHCAITSVVVRNLGSDALTVERLNLPMPRLSLFYSRRSGFWTDALTLERREGSEHASMRSDRQPPQQASPHQFISPPRQAAVGDSLMVRAFSGLFR